MAQKRARYVVSRQVEHDCCGYRWAVRDRAGEVVHEGGRVISGGALVAVPGQTISRVISEGDLVAECYRRDLADAICRYLNARERSNDALLVGKTANA